MIASEAIAPSVQFDARKPVRYDGAKTWIRVHVQRIRQEMDGACPDTVTERGRHWRSHWAVTGLTTVSPHATHCDTQAIAMRYAREAIDAAMALGDVPESIGFEIVELPDAVSYWPGHL